MIERYALASLTSRINSAATTTHVSPSDGQKAAGNYRKGRFWLHGKEFVIETPQGEVRRGKNGRGESWESPPMPSHYGYIRRTLSEADGDHLDVFVGPRPWSPVVWVIDQHKPDGSFDEHKCCVGFSSEEAAKQAYRDSFHKSWKGLGHITALTVPQFLRWMDKGDTGKPIHRQERTWYSKGFDPDEQRDAKGRWTGGGSDAESSKNERESTYKTARQLWSLKTIGGSNQAKSVAKKFTNRPLKNLDSGITATVSGESLSKMLSLSSMKESDSRMAHLLAVANLDKLFPIALHRESRPDRDENPDISAMHHFDVPMPFEDDIWRVKILAKEFSGKERGTRLYHVAAIQIEKPASKRGSSDSASPNHPSIPPAGFNERFARLVEAVKSANPNRENYSRLVSEFNRAMGCTVERYAAGVQGGLFGGNQKRLAFDEDKHPRETAATVHEGKRPGEFAPATHDNPATSAPAPAKKSTRYDQVVADNMHQMGSGLEEWSAVPVKKMAATGDDRGNRIAMPEFSFPKGYGEAPSKFSHIKDCCHLCGTGIKKVYWIQNDSKKWTMPVGSECVGRFGEGHSGEKAAKLSVAIANRDFVKSMKDAKRELLDKHSATERKVSAYGIVGSKRKWNSVEAGSAYQKLGESLGDVTHQLHDNGEPIWTDRQIANWLKKQGTKPEEALRSAREFLDQQGSAGLPQPPHPVTSALDEAFSLKRESATRFVPKNQAGQQADLFGTTKLTHSPADAAVKPQVASLPGQGSLLPKTTVVGGDEARFTGKSQTIAGGTFHEVEMLEGANKGQTKLVRDDGEKASEASRKISERKDEQAGFARLHDMAGKPGSQSGKRIVPKEPWEMTQSDWHKTDEGRAKLDSATSQVRADDERQFLSTRGKPKDAAERRMLDAALTKRRNAPLNDFSQVRAELLAGHKDLVRSALASGRHVPPEVLADYPDLKSNSPVARHSLAAAFRSCMVERYGHQLGFKFREEDHPRGQSENAGEFRKKDSPAPAISTPATPAPDSSSTATKPKWFAKGNDVHESETGARRGAFRDPATATRVAGMWNERDTPKVAEPVETPAETPKPEPHPVTTAINDQVAQKKTSSEVADEWLTGVAGDIQKLRDEHGDLLMRKSLTDSLNKKLKDGEITQDVYDSASKKLRTLTPEEYKKALWVQHEMDEIRKRPLPPDPDDVVVSAATPETSSGVIPGLEPEKPSETPRDAAARQQKALDADYAFARKSEVPNAGEDLLGSARHKRNAWRSLADAEQNGTAAELVTRDNLLRNEPHNLMTLADKNPLTALAMNYALSKFPAKPYDDKHAYYKRQGAETHKKYRSDYLDAYRELKAEAEKLAETESNPKLALGKFSIRAMSLAEKHSDSRRIGPNQYHPLARTLYTTYKNTSTSYGRPHPTHAYRAVQDFEKRAGERYGDGGSGLADNKSKIAGHVKDIIEGDSLNKTFGTVATDEKKFDPAAMYIEIAKRVGGRDVSQHTRNANHSAKHLLDSFGVRGVQWGNSVTDDERQHHGSKVVEALTDLADTLGLKPEDISLNGKLGLAIGARGHGNALAHYEPNNQVINLTRRKGAGTIAHEWGHGFDHLLNEFKMRSDGGSYHSQDTMPERIATEKTGRVKLDSAGKPIREDRSADPVWKAMEGVRKAWESTGYGRRLHGVLSKMVSEKRMSRNRASDYWNSHEEKFARTFERYVQRKMSASNQENTYLSGFNTETHWSGNDKHKGDDKGAALWPTDTEADAMIPAFDGLIAAYRQKKYGSPEPQKYSRSQLVAAFNEMLSVVESRPAVDRYELAPHVFKSIAQQIHGHGLKPLGKSLRAGGRLHGLPGWSSGGSGQFDPSKHPRAPEGSATGGKFVSKGGATGGSATTSPSNPPTPLAASTPVPPSPRWQNLDPKMVEIARAKILGTGTRSATTKPAQQPKTPLEPIGKLGPAPQLPEHLKTAPPAPKPKHSVGLPKFGTQLTADEAKELAGQIRDGDPTSKNRGEPSVRIETGPMVMSKIPTNYFDQFPDEDDGNRTNFIRSTTSPDRVKQYEAMSGDSLPPINVTVNRSGFPILSDGGHRLIAAINRGDKDILALVPPELHEKLHPRPQVTRVVDFTKKIRKPRAQPAPRLKVHDVAKAAAEKRGVNHSDVLSMMRDIHRQRLDEHARTESIRKQWMDSHPQWNAARIRRHEGDHDYDSIPGYDQFVEGQLAHGGFGGQGGTYRELTSSDPHSELWNIIHAGAKPKPKLGDEDIADEAARYVADNQPQFSTPHHQMRRSLDQAFESALQPVVASASSSGESHQSHETEYDDPAKGFFSLSSALSREFYRRFNSPSSSISASA